MTALMVMTDGRLDCITRAIPSVFEQLGEHHFDHAVIHDDSGDPDYREALLDLFPAFTVIGGSRRRGFTGAVRAARDYLRPLAADWIWWHEDDFLITRPVDLAAMQTVMETRSYLAQIALLRQPVNASEIAAGGVLEQHPLSWFRVTDGDQAWREHRRFFTTNPSLFRGSLLENEWPDRPESEGHFGISLFHDPMVMCAYWGGDGEWCEHIGHTRLGTGY